MNVQNVRRAAPRPPELRVELYACPVRASLGVLGRKWTLLILRNIGLYHQRRFGDMLKITTGLSRRMLSKRLRELKSDGFVEARAIRGGSRGWYLTEKGRDVLPVLLALVYFGAKWSAEGIFADGRPRGLYEVLQPSYVRGVLQTLLGKSRRDVSRSAIRPNPGRLTYLEGPTFDGEGT